MSARAKRLIVAIVAIAAALTVAGDLAVFTLGPSGSAKPISYHPPSQWMRH